MFFNDQQSIDAEISEMMREVANIQNHMRPIVVEVYDRFLVDSADIELREYAEPALQIEAAFIHRSYISQKDINLCLDHDLEQYRPQAGFGAIEALHLSLRQQYAEN